VPYSLGVGNAYELAFRYLYGVLIRNGVFYCRNTGTILLPNPFQVSREASRSGAGPRCGFSVSDLVRKQLRQARHHALRQWNLGQKAPTGGLSFENDEPSMS